MSLDARRLQAIELLCAGMPRKQVAERVGVSYPGLWNWGQDPEFKEALAERHRQVKELVQSIVPMRLAEEAEASLNTVVELRDNARSERVRLTASQDVLDRAGFSPVHKSIAATVHVLSPEVVELLKGVLAEEATIGQPRTITALPERALPA